MKRVKRLFRPLVRRYLTPRTVQLLRFRYWCVSSYLPRVLSGWLIKRTPEIRSLGDVMVRSNLAKQLEDVNLLAPTKMCRVMAKYGSDKSLNHYTPVYSALFKQRADQDLRVFELGLGTNNLDVESNMGVFGSPGASLRGWRELFPRATVYGADVDHRILFEDDRIKTYFCDQLNQASIRELWSNEDLREGADIIIEDGLHTFDANVSFLEESLEHLRPDGIYVTEDISWESFEQWCKQFAMMKPTQRAKYEFALVVLASRGTNNLLIVRRVANQV